MRLSWGRRQRTDSEATAARKKAEAELERVQAETAYYAALGESLRQLREANHLTELFFVNRHRTREQ
jgi:hypothetical protein